MRSPCRLNCSDTFDLPTASSETVNSWMKSSDPRWKSSAESLDEIMDDKLGAAIGPWRH
jgi:hypothetical protein